MTPSSQRPQIRISPMSLLNVTQVWSQCLEIIRDNVGEQSYRTWFQPIIPLNLESNVLTIQIPSRFFYEWLEEHYVDLLWRTIKRVVNDETELEYCIVKQAVQPAKPVPSAKPTVAQSPAQPTPQFENRGGVDSVPMSEKPLFSTNGHHEQPREQFGRYQQTKATDQRPGFEPANQQRREQPTSMPMRNVVANPRGGNYFRSEERESEPETNVSEIKNPFVIPGVKRENKVLPELKTDYVFDTFVEGNCNELARSAGMAVAERPGGTSFNPLYLVGGVGLGKTHLAHAIGNYTLRRFGDKTVVYVSAEKFTNQFINSVRNGTINNFTMFYQSVDVLIVDDIQFLESKQRTQDIFFHIFNHLHQANKQIVLTSDRNPKELKNVQDRLISRFKWGLTADLSTPDYETRIAILQKKLSLDSHDEVALPRDVIEYVAHNIDTNVRELEGALVQLIARARLMNEDIDIGMSRRIVRMVIDQTKSQTLSNDEITNIVCKYYQLDVEKVQSKSRKRELTQTRQVCMHFIKKINDTPLKAIGKLFGGRDHSTVHHSITTIANEVETNRQLKRDLEAIEKQLSMH